MLVYKLTNENAMPFNDGVILAMHIPFIIGTIAEHNTKYPNVNAMK